MLQWRAEFFETACDLYPSKRKCFARPYPTLCGRASPRSAARGLSYSIAKMAGTTYWNSQKMQEILYHAIAVAVLAVGAVLLVGLRTLMRGGNPSLSQTLMRWRIGLQTITIIMILLYDMMQHTRT